MRYVNGTMSECACRAIAGANQPSQRALQLGNAQPGREAWPAAPLRGGQRRVTFSQELGTVQREGIFARKPREVSDGQSGAGSHAPQPGRIKVETGQSCHRDTSH